MHVMDIVNRAVMKSGVVSSFNPDEVPEDIQQRGADVLRNEIIPDLNCDRAVDITETVIPYTPKNGKIHLVTTPLDYPNFIMESVDVAAHYLNITETASFAPGNPPIPYMKNLIDLLVELELVTLTGSPNPYSTLTKTNKWPSDQLGQYRDIAFWTDDVQLFEVPADFTKLYGEAKPDFVNHKYNIPFYPAYIGEVYRASDGAEFRYLHHGEMVSAEFRYSQLVYTVEDNITKMSVVFNKQAFVPPVLLVVPVPVKVINSFEEENPWDGDIVAPQKFFSFLINILAWRMAAEYGVDTEAKMEKAATVSYSNIVKNKIKREHPQDIPRKIFEYLRCKGRLAPVETNGYTGGFYG